jgi:hypothetical protein
MNDTDAEFEISMFQYESCGATTCEFERDTRRFREEPLAEGLDFPEIERFVNESHAIGVEIARDADFTEDRTRESGEPVPARKRVCDVTRCRLREGE